MTIEDALKYSSEITATMTNIATSIPIAIYFLGFINYFTMSSLYVLLNFKLPEALYKYLAFSYEQINQEVLGLFGFQLAELDPLSDERVTSKRGLFFGVTSDFVPSNLLAFIFMGSNIAFILTLQFFTSFLRKNNFLRKIIRK